ncbi:MAG TPA: hypothetical protein VFU63_06840 [Ktedonobacterales bacterium]|nr:hypothetical protein [Ktedonobacterales bacterium]
MAMAAYVAVLRPWLLQWGSTAAERTMPLPGDELVPTPTHVTTRAITIQAPTHAVWPWLVQMGQDRAGFYTHNWVERVLQSGIPDVHDLHPEWQELHVGNLMRTNRELRAGHPLGWTVLRIESEHTLMLWSRSVPRGTYAFALHPLRADQTRLLVRDRAIWRWWQAPFRLLVFGRSTATCRPANCRVSSNGQNTGLQVGSRQVSALATTWTRERLDDTRDPARAPHSDLENALRDLFAGSPVAVPETRPFGCAIVR